MSQSKTADVTTYFHPSQGEAVRAQVEEAIQMALEQGCEYPTLTQYTISWAEDQDPFGHVMWQAYSHIFGRCFSAMLESFQGPLGDKFHDFMTARGISAVTGETTQNVKRMVKYPDLLVNGARLLEVRPDRLCWRFSAWSTTQKTVVAELEGWTVFFDHKAGKKADLLREGGAYADLYTDLVRRMEKSTEIQKKWEENQKVASRRANL